MRKDNEKLDLETINRYWGSLEAYQEEQRRSALVDLEHIATDTDEKAGWNWDFTGRSRRKNAEKRPANGSFRLFGRHS